MKEIKFEVNGKMGIPNGNEKPNFINNRFVCDAQARVW